MTRPRYDEHSTEFGLWLRVYGPDSKKDGLDIENLDYIMFNYKQGWLACIEEKRHEAKLTWAQEDTLFVVDQLLRYGAETERVVKTRRGWRQIKYNGLYVVRFENTKPEDGWIELNGKQIVREDLIQFLRTGKLENFSKKEGA